DRRARGARAYEPRDQHPAVHQPANGRMAPAQGVHQARHQLPQRAPRGPVRPGTGAAADVAIPLTGRAGGTGRGAQRGNESAQVAGGSALGWRLEAVFARESEVVADLDQVLIRIAEVDAEDGAG